MISFVALVFRQYFINAAMQALRLLKVFIANGAERILMPEEHDFDEQEIIDDILKILLRDRAYLFFAETRKNPIPAKAIIVSPMSSTRGQI